MVKKKFSMDDRRKSMSSKYGADLSIVHRKLIDMHSDIFRNIDESVRCIAFLNKAIKSFQSGMFDNLIMTESVNLTIRSVITTNIMALARAWDTDYDTPSIPNAAALLVTIGYETYKITDQPKETLEKIISQREDIFNKVKNITESDILRRFKLHRNNYIAHDLPHKTNKENELYVDEDTYICKKSIEIVEMLTFELKTETKSLLNLEKIAKKEAEAFWNCLCSGQRA